MLPQQTGHVQSVAMARDYRGSRCAIASRFYGTASCFKGFGTAVLTLTAVAPLSLAAKYPQEALRCLASLTEPEELLICPEHRFARLQLGKTKD